MSKRLFDVPASWLTVSPLHDDRVAYEMGLDEANRQARIMAFGAIRRAAEVARKADREAETLRLEEFDWQSARVASEAIGMRRAIRAAIGSEKT